MDRQTIRRREVNHFGTLSTGQAYLWPLLFLQAEDTLPICSSNPQTTGSISICYCDGMIPAALHLLLTVKCTQHQTGHCSHCPLAPPQTLPNYFITRRTTTQIEQPYSGSLPTNPKESNPPQCNWAPTEPSQAVLLKSGTGNQTPLTTIQMTQAFPVVTPTRQVIQSIHPKICRLQKMTTQTPLASSL